jgi:hypothetical protein
MQATTRTCVILAVRALAGMLVVAPAIARDNGPWEGVLWEIRMG